MSFTAEFFLTKEEIDKVENLAELFCFSVLYDLEEEKVKVIAEKAEDFEKTIRDFLKENKIEVSDLEIYEDKTDYLAQNKELFKSFKIGNVIIFSAKEQFEEEKNSLKKEETPIIINPAMAFGTGKHETTSLMIEEINSLKLKNIKALDMGTGSGILAFIIEKILKAKEVFALDIDETSVIVAKELAKENAIEKVKLLISEGFSNEEITKEKDFDLIVSNIFLNPLINLREDFEERLKKDGRLIVSGFYVEDEDTLIKEYLKSNFKLINKNSKNNWAVLHFIKE